MRWLKTIGRITVPVACAILAATGLASAPAARAVTPSPPSVTIVSPSADGPVSGTVTFTVAIDQEDATHPVTEVYLEIYGATQGHQSQTINVAAGQCAPTCEIGASFDTRTLIVPTDPDPVHSLPDLPDGTAEFAASVSTRFGPTGFTYADIDIDNHRPTFSLPDLPLSAYGSVPTWTGFGTLTTEVQTTANPVTQEPVTSFRLMAPSFPTTPLADMGTPAPQAGTGTISFDVSKVRPISVTGYLVAVDASGVASAIHDVTINLPVAYEVGGTTDPDYTDQATMTVVPTWYDGSDASQTWLTSVTVSLNGSTLIGQGNNFPAGHESATVSLHTPDGTPLPSGSSIVTIRAVDNRGIERDNDVMMTLQDPVTPTWSVGRLVTGSPTSVSATTSDASSSPMQSIRLLLDGVPVASSDAGGYGPTAVAAPKSTVIQPGTHTATLETVLADGVRYIANRAVTAKGRAAIEFSAPRSTEWGRNSTFHAVLMMLSKPQPNVRLTLQSRAPGASLWFDRATATTDARGCASFSIPAARTGKATWRVVSPASALRLAGTSTARFVGVRSHFTALPKPATIHRGHTKTYRLYVSPRGGMVTVQYHRQGASRWWNRSHVTISPTGWISFSVTFRSIGNYALRVWRPATSQVVATASPGWPLQVTR